ncbi:outer membrane insertion C- signal [Algoriphagus sp. CAU 1675]|uniref:outer membrane insertion C- signal n=1 Tax=Algoriphagus sp. CAU 1675 TaxID=3032597 RepID=UPI0023D99A7D|nr:outer membrane insertion C- signal [Algoriphagus sp. CAU 1675]MDF2156357.1 outer membrane insertion C- signal [Algoriphagus sp. CAU 1675]
MKLLKIFSLVLFLGLFAAMESHAQEVGIRFGNVNGNDVALDAVFSLGEFSRVHGDLSFGNSGMGIDLLWNPIYRPIENSDFNYYIGFGPSLFLGDPFRLGAAGEIGAEYAFADVPLVIGLDWRPYFILVEDTDFNAGGFGLNVRWRLK